ncbi:hypothetical protein HK405_008457 [Cladochytrium tenue]|nr:hypothetical protein HK405_008457 [Cladochytrium tenue]
MTTPQKVVAGPAERDVAELDRTLRSTPLFMTQLPTAGDAAANDALNALHALLYDGDPNEVALNFKNQGNEAFREGPRRYRDAIEFYSKGLAVDGLKDPPLTAVLYVNRAAVNLELGNYRKVLQDCAAALRIDPRATKALYRSARALLALDMLAEAKDCLERGLAIDPVNKGMRDALAAVVKRQEQQAKADERRREEEARRQTEEKELWDTIAARGYNAVFTNHKNNRGEASSSTSEDSDSDADDNWRRGRGPRAQAWAGTWTESHRPTLDANTGQLAFPVLFLYPEHSESDLVAAFGEQDRFGDHLEAMFGDDVAPAGWDAARAYRASGLEVYFETRPDLDGDGGGVAGGRNGRRQRGRLLKVGRRSRLLDVLRHPDFRLVDGFATFFVVPVAAAAFRAEFLARYGNP